MRRGGALSLPDPRCLPADVRRAAAWGAHEAPDIAPWPVLRYWNPEYSLRRHQRTGSAFMYLGMETLLADPVGTGKTAHAAAVLAMCAENGELGPDNRAVVVCGAAATGQWVRELRKFTRGIHVVAATGTRAQRDRAYLSPWHVCVVSDRTFAPTRNRDGDIERLRDWPVGILFYDDLDPMRNRTTQTARAIRRLAAECSRVHGLHGTPLQKRLAELYCELEPLGSYDLFGSYDDFRQRYVTQERFTIWIPVNKAFGSEKTKWARGKGFGSYPELTRQAAADRAAGRKSKARDLAAAVESGRSRLQRVLWKDNGVNTDRLPEFQRMIAPVTLRRTTADLDDVTMPEVQPAPVELELLPAQRARYAELRQGVLTRLREGEEPSRQQVDAVWTRGAQICSGLAALDDHGGADVSVKLDWVISAVTNDLSDEKVIVFVYYKPNVAALSDRLSREGIGHELLWSNETSSAVRDASIARFWEDPDCRVIAGTTTMAKSLNLQVARHVITADWVMNPAVMEQIVGRARRDGSQHATVYWHQLLALDTQEDHYLDLLSSEARMADAVWGTESEITAALTPRQKLGLIVTPPERQAAA